MSRALTLDGKTFTVEENVPFGVRLKPPDNLNVWEWARENVQELLEYVREHALIVVEDVLKLKQNDGMKEFDVQKAPRRHTQVAHVDGDGNPDLVMWYCEGNSRSPTVFTLGSHVQLCMFANRKELLRILPRSFRPYTRRQFYSLLDECEEGSEAIDPRRLLNIAGGRIRGSNKDVSREDDQYWSYVEAIHEDLADVSYVHDWAAEPNTAVIAHNKYPNGGCFPVAFHRGTYDPNIESQSSLARGFLYDRSRRPAKPKPRRKLLFPARRDERE